MATVINVQMPKKSHCLAFEMENNTPSSLLECSVIAGT